VLGAVASGLLVPLPQFTVLDGIWAGFVPKNVLVFFRYERLGAATTGRALALLAAPRQMARNRF
jgi:hypothetical protein